MGIHRKGANLISKAFNAYFASYVTLNLSYIDSVSAGSFSYTSFYSNDIRTFLSKVKPPFHPGPQDLPPAVYEYSYTSV